MTFAKRDLLLPFPGLKEKCSFTESCALFYFLQKVRCSIGEPYSSLPCITTMLPRRHGLRGISIAMAIGRFFGDALIAHFGPVFIVRLGGLVSAAGIFLAILSGNYFELLGFFLIGLGASNIVSHYVWSGRQASWHICKQCFDNRYYTRLQRMLLGPAFIGFIAESTTLSLSLSFVAALLIAVALSAGKIEKTVEIKI